MNDFWNKENFKILKKALLEKYHNEFLSKALNEVHKENQTSTQDVKKNAGIKAKILWSEYKNKNNIKISKPKIRYDPIYYKNSVSVTADEYRIIKEDYYNVSNDTVIVQSPIFEATPSTGTYNYNYNIKLDNSAVSGQVPNQLEEYIELPEALARKIVVLYSFKNQT